MCLVRCVAGGAGAASQDMEEEEEEEAGGGPDAPRSRIVETCEATYVLRRY